MAMSPGRAERVDARGGEREVHAAVDLVVGADGLVPRSGPPVGGGGVAGDRVGQRVPVGPGPPRHRLDDHDADIALGADGEELLGRLTVLGPGPQGGVDREHHRVEVEAAQRLEVRLRHLEVVAGDAGEARLAGLAELEDLLERGRAPVELLQGGDRVRLVEVEHLGVEQAPRGAELLGDADGIGPQGLARDEQLVPVRRQVRAHHRLGRTVLRGDVEVVHAVVEGELQPLARRVHGGVPAGRTAEDGHTALVARPPEAPTLHHPLRL